VGARRYVGCLRAPSLNNPDRPPYPGVVVATQDVAGPEGARSVRVEVWTGDEPAEVHCVHETVLWVGTHGVYVGNDQGPGAWERLMLEWGDHPLRVLVDADRPDQVTRVIFALGQHRTRPLPRLPTERERLLLRSRRATPGPAPQGRMPGAGTAGAAAQSAAALVAGEDLNLRPLGYDKSARRLNGSRTWREARGADKVITDAIDAHMEERRDDGDGMAGTLVPAV
jgi:hypothetical protein